MKLSSLSTGILVLGLFAGCGDDEGAGVTPDASSPSSETSAVADDAGADAEVASSSEAVTSSEVTHADAAVAPEAGASSGGDVTDAAVASTAEATSAEVSGDAAAGDAGDGGSSGGGEECSPGSASGSDAPDDECTTLAAQNWCENYTAEGACLAVYATRDASIYAAYVDCMNDALAAAEACSGDVDAVVFECYAAADLTACPVHVDACDAYEGCESDTVEQCDQVAAKYHDAFIADFAELFACGTSAASALGEE